ncbi:MAG TPA: glycosyltransferase family 2 protein [Candidatus Moranbacteria bacterium]|nr:glycosyltransferase family 2 protein [Candidatus Moranbacteria bacterium]HSA08601.1 glycosyltransferase family 2 protein [Candidatus Moranbacteria bacterium]
MKLISIIIPVYNEEKNIPLIHGELRKIFANLQNYDFEIIFVNDGSQDKSIEEIRKLSEADQNVKYIDFSRNFGKEIATTAGINNCQGDACIMLDADLQHPPSVIPEFLAKWENGAEVVVGVRKKNHRESLIKSAGSWFYYKIINNISETSIVPDATDFRLLDRIVIDEFNKFSERNRMTRALIAWLGFRREYMLFDSPARAHGKAAYSTAKLIKLALSSFVSMSLLPLKLAGYLGIMVTILSGLLGLFIFFDKYIWGDPFGFSFSGPASMAVLNTFFIGIVLSCLGLIALYIANIHGEVINRPMYVIRKRKL